MTSTSARTMFSTYKEFDPTKITYGTVKQNARGGKSVPILYQGKPLRVQTPLTFNWGVNEMEDESSGVKKFSMNFSLDKTSGTPVGTFFEKMDTFQTKILKDAVSKSKEWFGKAKMSEDVIRALFYDVLKYPKNKETDEPDETRNPSLKVKLPYWQGKFNFELYDMNRNQLCARGQDEEDVEVASLIPKASHVSAIIECGGVWFAAGRFGVTFKFVLGKVRPPARLQGYCLVEDSEEEGELEQIEAREKERALADEEEEAATAEVVDSEPEEVEAEAEPEPAPKKKTKVVRKKKVAA